jgi:hypothetical protein
MMIIVLVEHNKVGASGPASYYRKWRHLEVMFQVAPMIAARERRQPIVGNTIVTIVFQDGGKFDPSCITSQVLRM